MEHHLPFHSLSPLAWLVIGLLAGAISGRLIRGRGYGCCMDIVVGVIGGFIGGAAVNYLLPGTSYGFWGSLGVATLGSIALLLVLRVFIPRY